MPHRIRRYQKRLMRWDIQLVPTTHERMRIREQPRYRNDDDYVREATEKVFGYQRDELMLLGLLSGDLFEVLVSECILSRRVLPLP